MVSRDGPRVAVTPSGARVRSASAGLSGIEEAIAAIAAGQMVVVVDDEDRENEGDLVIATKYATPEVMGFFVRHTSGLICAAITNQRADELRLPLMVPRNTEAQRTAFTVTVDYRIGTTTGISASDRSATARALVDPMTRPDDLARPGHLHVLRAGEGGVLKRAGHTEAAVDLTRMAGLTPAAVLCEIISEDGMEMARPADLVTFAAEHNLLLITISDLVRYRQRTERLVHRIADARMPTEFGDFRCVAYQSLIGGETHLAFVMGDPGGHEDVLVRVHNECMTGDVFGSRRCDCGDQLHAAMRLIAAESQGVLVYLRGHESRGIGIPDESRAYELQDCGVDTIHPNVQLGLPVESREHDMGAQMLVDLGITTMRLMSNNPAEQCGFEGYGLKIVDRVGLHTEPTPTSHPASTDPRVTRMGHIL